MLLLNLPEVVPSELQYADDLDLMGETIEGLRSKFFRWKDPFEKGDFKVFEKHSMQKMFKEYWRGSGAGRMQCGGNCKGIHISW